MYIISIWMFLSANLQLHLLIAKFYSRFVFGLAQDEVPGLAHFVEHCAFLKLRSYGKGELITFLG